MFLYYYFFFALMPFLTSHCARVIYIIKKKASCAKTITSKTFDFASETKGHI